MDEQERLKQLDILKKRLKEKFEEMAEPMEKIDFSEENYNRLFIANRVSTPVGEVKLGENQYKKLEIKNRKKYLGGMYQTLADPILITDQEDCRGKARIFSKSFIHGPKKKDGLISVVVDIDSESVSISTHPKHLRKIVESIKNAADLVYEKPGSGRTAGNDSENLAISSDTQLLNNISQYLPDVNKTGVFGACILLVYLI